MKKFAFWVFHFFLWMVETFCAELIEILLYWFSSNLNYRETPIWEFKDFDLNRYCEIRFAHWMICLNFGLLSNA